MKYKIFGRSGLRVSEICLGTMTFGEEFKWGSSKAESERVFQTFVGAGGNFIDTADYYTRGTSETFLGEWIAPIRDSIVLATKYSMSTDPKNPNAGGNHRKNMVQSVEASLKRLKTDYIDLYWVHAWDFTVAIDEVLRALDDLVRAGKILHIGASNIPAWLVSRGNAIAELRGWSCFTGLQLQYNLAERSIERDFFPMAKALNLGITAWSPLAMGLLTGKYNKELADQSRFKINDYFRGEFLTERNMRIAKELGSNAAQTALAWILAKDVIPIVGAKSAEQLKQNLKAVDLKLSPEQVQHLDAISEIDRGYLDLFLNRPGIRKALVKEGTDDE